jgi:hypothetical protein
MKEQEARYLRALRDRNSSLLRNVPDDIQINCAVGKNWVSTWDGAPTLTPLGAVALEAHELNGSHFGERNTKETL